LAETESKIGAACAAQGLSPRAAIAGLSW